MTDAPTILVAEPEAERMVADAKSDAKAQGQPKLEEIITFLDSEAFRRERTQVALIMAGANRSAPVSALRTVVILEALLALMHRVRNRWPEVAKIIAEKKGEAA